MGILEELALLAWYRANVGEEPAAREALARAEALSTERGEIAFLGAQTFALLGDTAAARERLEQARAHDIPLQRIQASPVLRPLSHGVATAKTGADSAEP
jgi:hypothetical protein